LRRHTGRNFASSCRLIGSQEGGTRGRIKREGNGERRKQEGGQWLRGREKRGYHIERAKEGQKEGKEREKKRAKAGREEQEGTQH
jgi:hypothetical protein